MLSACRQTACSAGDSEARARRPVRGGRMAVNAPPENRVARPTSSVPSTAGAASSTGIISGSRNDCGLGSRVLPQACGIVPTTGCRSGRASAFTTWLLPLRVHVPSHLHGLPASLQGGEWPGRAAYAGIILMRALHVSVQAGCDAGHRDARARGREATGDEMGGIELTHTDCGCSMSERHCPQSLVTCLKWRRCIERAASGAQAGARSTGAPTTPANRGCAASNGCVCKHCRCSAMEQQGTVGTAPAWLPAAVPRMQPHAMASDSHKTRAAAGAACARSQQLQVAATGPRQPFMPCRAVPCLRRPPGLMQPRLWLPHKAMHAARRDAQRASSSPHATLPDLSSCFAPEGDGSCGSRETRQLVLPRRQAALTGIAALASLCWAPQARASKLPGFADSAWEAMGGGPADLTFPEEWLGVWDVISTLTKVGWGPRGCCCHACARLAAQPVPAPAPVPQRQPIACDPHAAAQVETPQGRDILPRGGAVVARAEQVAARTLSLFGQCCCRRVLGAVAACWRGRGRGEWCQRARCKDGSSAVEKRFHFLQQPAAGTRQSSAGPVRAIQCAHKDCPAATTSAPPRPHKALTALHCPTRCQEDLDKPLRYQVSFVRNREGRVIYDRR
jgi:hypothetical protein